MSRSRSMDVITKDGLHGVLETPIQPSEAGNRKVVLHLDNGQEILIPAELFALQEDGIYYLPLSLSGFQAGQEAQQPTSSNNMVIPIIEEKLAVHKHRRQTGVTRVSKRVHEHEEIIDEPSIAEEVEVTRLPVNKRIDEPVSVRQEGDTTVIPVVEEILVVEKRLVLKEEVRVTRRRKEIRNPQQVTLRKEEVTVERIPGETNPER